MRWGWSTTLRSNMNKRFTSKRRETGRGWRVKQPRPTCRFSAMSDANAQLPPCFLCRCEEIEEGEILNAIAEGAQSVNDVKRRTRAGMGVCQGAYCVSEIAKLIN